jgi:hypothetical protein
MTEYIKISELQRASTVTDNDLFVIETAQGTKAIDRAAFKTSMENVSKADVGLGNCDNTSDLDKPISTATQTALDAKADTSALNNYLTTVDAEDLYAPKAGMASTYLSKVEAIAYYVSKSDWSSLQTELTNFVKQNIITLTSNTPTLEAGKVYTMTPTGNVTITLAQPDDTTILNQIILQLNLTSVRTINVGTTYYINKKAPNLSATGSYNLIWEWDKANSKWVCGLLTKGEA